MKSTMQWLLPCCLVFALFSTASCKRTPKEIIFNGKNYFYKNKHRALAFSILTYLQKGQEIATAKDFVNIAQTKLGNVNADKATTKRAIAQYAMMVRRFDPKHKSYKQGSQFCYRQRTRHGRILVLATFAIKKGDVRMFQYGRKMTQEDQEQEIESLCEEAPTMLAELQEVAKRF